jgi:YidC/Oxa1 family membrane protein insertase
MTHEKRLIVFFLIVVAWMVGSTYISRLMGWNPPPKKPPPFAAGKDIPKQPDLPDAGAPPKVDAPGPDGGVAEMKKAQAKPGAPQPPKEPEVEVVEESELVLGSAADHSPEGYRLEAHLTQKGAGIEALFSSRFSAEFEFGKAGRHPLEFIRRDRGIPGDKHFWPPSLSLTLSAGNAADNKVGAEPDPADADDDDVAALKRAAGDAEDVLDSVLWEVVRDPATKKIVQSVSGTDLHTKAPVTGQSIAFRTTAKSGIVATKTFRLFPNVDSIEVELKFESPDRERSTVYNLMGPHGIPVEGLWYTSTFRDVFFGQLGSTEILTHSAGDIAAAKEGAIDNTTLPLRFAGVENQHFAILIEPVPPPARPEDRWDSKTIALLLHKTEQVQQSDVGFKITAKPISVGPQQPVVHTYRVFAGPKTVDALVDYGAELLASYHKQQWTIPLAPSIARFAITPTLGFTYEVTRRVAKFFGGSKGNYGIAIIMLTILVRGLMFPLGRKQALMAQKMQNLQPHLKELQEKYKDDKEKLTKETFALYKKHGANPVAGCLPALIQLPIFVGLWQAINTSFPLRQATFLWIRDLAAPDMMFHLPFEVPYLGPWFNLLPFLVVGLMLVQTKLFAPPATTPEAEMQQKMMKYMMVFMGFMFYKVPSGLGIYFITSSLWAIGERLLLPKVTHASKPASGKEGIDASAERGGSKGGTGQNGDGSGSRGGKGDGDGNGTKIKAKPPGKIAQFWERVLDEARKDPTYRKVADVRDDQDHTRDKDRPRPKPRRR